MDVKALSHRNAEISGEAPRRATIASTQATDPGNHEREVADFTDAIRITGKPTPQNAPWMQVGGEPSIADLLSDPTVLALMRADGVHVREILAIIGRVIRPSTGVSLGGFRVASSDLRSPICATALETTVLSWRKAPP